ncbi:4Fe-4S ferredoxin [Methanoculleus taiwanensis]|uniref:4Fe-4S ferredoxin n=1 Tax=Methanoculleus taiwanensis TaxID=1550565 RepID=A0A498H1C1_9EURY|nr:4Fe-4S binding protein [Methanoculleus taiwanensis]RXE56463.1 4Fe-4S ferredoxin [Methanoculleus taiwanensis]
MVLGSAPKALGIAYAVLAVIVLASLWHSGWFSRRRAAGFLLVSAALGFLIFSPVFPYILQLVILGDTRELGVLLPAAAAGLLVFIAVTLFCGRIVCGQICPVGAVQELIYLIPVPRHGRNLTPRAMSVRIGIFIVILATGVGFSVNLLGIIGLKDFFFLSPTSPGFAVFFAIVLVSVTVYRPFCRFICPYGVFLAIGAARSRWKIRRTDACIQCGRCERACPVNVATAENSRAECYLCGRCTEVCPVEGALVYGRKS